MVRLSVARRSLENDEGNDPDNCFKEALLVLLLVLLLLLLFWISPLSTST
jgi:hypothetical protein